MVVERDAPDRSDLPSQGDARARSERSPGANDVVNDVSLGTGRTVDLGVNAAGAARDAARGPIERLPSVLVVLAAMILLGGLAAFGWSRYSRSID